MSRCDRRRRSCGARRRCRADCRAAGCPRRPPPPAPTQSRRRARCGASRRRRAPGRPPPRPPLRPAARTSAASHSAWPLRWLLSRVILNYTHMHMQLLVCWRRSRSATNEAEFLVGRLAHTWLLLLFVAQAGADECLRVAMWSSVPLFTYTNPKTLACSTIRVHTTSTRTHPARLLLPVGEHNDHDEDDRLERHADDESEPEACECEWARAQLPYQYTIGTVQ